MKYLVISVLAFLTFSCTAKREVYVPVLLDYELYYPDEARRQGIEGTVHVRVLVNRSGKAEDVVIAKSSGNLLLDSAGVRTAKTFEFSPAVMGERTTKSWVLVPIEFTFQEINYEEWLTEVEITRRRIEKTYDRNAIAELYELYKQMIFSPWEVQDLEFNYYVKEVVVKKAAEVWDGYWRAYPARVLLFVDIINRYPDSFTALKARADLGDFLETEKITMRHTLDPATSDTLINRINEAIKY